MKHVVFIFTGLLILTYSNIQSQSVKIGYINSNELISVMPEAASADSQLQIFASKIEKQITYYQQEYQKKLKEYNTKNESVDEAVRLIIEKELIEMEQKTQALQQDYPKKRQELYEPIIKKAKEAIDFVAKERKYNCVLDTSTGLVLFSEKSDDLLELVKKKLGIK